MSARDENALRRPNVDCSEPDHLLAEAAASLQSDIDADVLAEAAHILTAERVALTLADRLEAAANPVTMTLRSGCRIEGTVDRRGDDVVVLVDRYGAEHCIALASAVTVRGLRPALSASEQGAQTGGDRGPRVASVSWGMFLRAESGIDVRLVLVDGTELSGSPALVGADHVDILGADGNVTTCALVSVSRAVRRGWTPDRR
jgi:hypothetical protein